MANIKVLAASIKKHGLVNPIVVTKEMTPKGIRYYLISGRSRVKAVRSLGQKEIMASIFGHDVRPIKISEIIYRVPR